MSKQPKALELAGALDTSGNLNVRAAAALLRTQHELICELAEALGSLDVRLTLCSKLPVYASDAYDSFYREVVSDALSKAKEQQR